MARVESYAIDTNVSDNDKVLGSDVGGATRNFKLGAVKDYVDRNISGAGRLGYRYELSVSDRLNGDFLANGGGSANLALNAITSFTISKKNSSGDDVNPMLLDILSNKLYLVEVGNVTVKGEFTIESYSDNSDNADFTDVTVTASNTNGNLTDGNYYVMSRVHVGDATYEHTQSSASTTWSINHNLEKKPSVSVADSSDNVIYGKVTYVDLNNLTITLSAPTSGKAYIN